MSNVVVPSPPPGWYVDTAAGGRMRWWTGADWTEHLSAAPQVPGAPGVSAASAEDVATTVLVGASRTYPVRAMVWGVIALVLANVLAGGLAILYGGLTLSRAAALEAQGIDSHRSTAKAGLILGIIGSVGGIVWLLLFISAMSVYQTRG